MEYKTKIANLIYEVWHRSDVCARITQTDLEYLTNKYQITEKETKEIAEVLDDITEQVCDMM